MAKQIDIVQVRRPGRNPDAPDPYELRIRHRPDSQLTTVVDMGDDDLAELARVVEEFRGRTEL